MKQKLLFLFALLLGSVSAWAEVGETFKDGSLLFKILTEEEGNYTCEVTKQSINASWNSVEIPETASNGKNTFNVTQIGEKAFYLCDINTLTIPEGVRTILERAFSITQIKTISIPSSVESIDVTAFDHTFILESFYVHENNAVYGTTDDHRCLINKNTMVLGSFAPAGLTEYSIPYGITKIGESAFSNTDLTSVIIPNSVTEIGTGAFSFAKLTSVTIPSSVNFIDNYAFQNNASLNSVTFEGEPTFGEEVFNMALFELYHKINNVVVPDNSSDEFLSALIEQLKKGEDSDFDPASIMNIVLLKEGESFSLGEAQSGKTVRYTRTFTKDCWQPLFLPISLSYTEWSEAGEVAKLTGYEDGELTWTKLAEDEATVAGTPYIIKPKNAGATLAINGQKDLAASTTINSTPYGDVTISGTYAEKDMSAEPSEGMCFWGLSDGDFYYTTSSAKTLKPYRIFLIAPKPATTSEARIRNVIVDGEETAVKRIEVEAPANAPAYNLAGQKVGEAYRGIVIVNGKKVLRK